MSKRAYFLTMDAFIAVSAVVIGIVVITAQYSFKPYEPQNIFYSEDVTGFLASTEVYKINDENLTYMKEYKANGNISEVDETLIEQITELVYRNGSDCPSCAEMARNLTEELVEKSVSTRYSYEVRLVNDTRTFTLLEKPRKSINTSELVTPSKRVITTTVQDEYLAVDTLEVIVWQ